MKVFLLVILLLPGLKLLDYACEQSARLDANSALTTYKTTAIGSDVYIHDQEGKPSGKQEAIKAPSRSGWIIKGLVVSLVVLISIGLVRERPRSGN